MEFVDEKHEVILQGSLKTFMTLGMRSVTMDDMAKNLGMSKKTLYKYVSDKSDLLVQAMSYFQECEMSLITEICKRKLNAIDESFEISKVVLNHISDIHPSVMFDIEKYYPEVGVVFDDYKTDVVRNWVIDNLQRGKKEGLFRPDVNEEIISGLYILRMDDLFNQEMFPKSRFATRDIYREIFNYHIRGIASEKGVKYLDKKLKEQSEVL